MILSKKAVYDKLVTKLNSIKVLNISGLVTKRQHDTDNQNLEKKIEDSNKKIPDTSELVKKTDCGTKIMEIKNKILRVTGLVTATALNTKATEIENKIPDITNLATKAALNTKATEIENKIPVTTHFINTQEFNRLTKISSAAKDFVSKTKVSNAIDLGEKIKKKINKLQKFDSGYFLGKSDSKCKTI